MVESTLVVSSADDSSILDSVKASLGIYKEDTSMDSEIMMHINGSLATLNSNGVGLPVYLVDNSTTWGDFKDPEQSEINKKFFSLPVQYVFVDVKINFDPPMASSLNSLIEVRKELLWRCRIEYEPKDTDSPEGR